MKVNPGRNTAQYKRASKTRLTLSRAGVMYSSLVVTSLLLGWASLVIGDCTYGASQLLQGKQSSKRGQFVDLDHPISCSGVLLSLRFCFYTNDLNDDRSTYRIFFRIFRHDPETDILRQTHFLERVFTVNDPRRSFLCEDHYYSGGENVYVLTGDYVAVYIPSLSEPLPVLGRKLPGMRVYEDKRGITSAFFSTTIPRSTLEAVEDMAIHVSAEIDVNTFINAFPTTPTENGSVPSVSPSISSSVIMWGLKVPSSSDSSTSMTSLTSSLNATPTVTTTSREGLPKELTTTTPAQTLATELTSTTIVKATIKTGGAHTRCSTESLIATVSVSKTSSITPPGENMDDTDDSSVARFQSWVIPLIGTGGFFLVIIIIIPVNVALCVCLRKRRKKKRLMLNKRASVKDIPTVYEIPQIALNRGSEQHSYDVLECSVYETIPTTEVSNSQPCATISTTEQDATYSMLGPEVDSSEQQTATVEPVSYMHYEMDVFEIYSTPVSIAKGENLSTRIRRVISTLKDQTPEPFHKPASEEEAIYKQLSFHNPAIHIPASEIQVRGRLGAGHFASVERGVWVSGNGTKDVAVKTLHKDAGAANRVKCLQEAAIMAQFHHPNIVLLHGIIIHRDDTISLVMEFLNGGDLSERLKTRHSDNSLDASAPLVLLNYSIQVTLGMLYPSEKGFVHRDLAARNVLISDKDICKIGDFGMSRELEDSIYYRSAGGTIPVKWTAPEAAFFRKYSSASDVWSYGCVLYEIWSLGHKPFSNLPNKEVLRKVTAGYRLPPPPGCPHDLYKLMIECWNPVPVSRPTFKDILTLLIGDEEQLLAIPFEDASTDGEACCLGATLRAGHKMYVPLQTKYLPVPLPKKAASQEEIYEHVS